MNHSLSIDQLKRLKVIMQMMLSEANNANWQELSRLDSERRVLIDYKVTASSNYKIISDKLSNIDQQQSGSLKKPVPGIPDLSASRQKAPPPPSMPGNTSSGGASDSEYQALSKELVAIDKEITKTVHKARQELLEQTRGLRAQVSAKKGYEQANTMKASSYS